MTHARKLKSKLRPYSTTTSNNDKQNNTTRNNNNDPTTSVTDKIARLRLEQARAEANRRRQLQQGSSFHTIRSEPVITYEHIPPWNVIENRQEAEVAADVLIASRRFIAGPPPPPSWTRSRVRHQLTNTNNLSNDILLQQRRQRLKNQGYEYFPSLVELCSRQLYFLYDHLSISTHYKKQFKSLPIHTKQMILYEWSILGGLTTITKSQLDLFSKTEYEELWLESSKLTMENLIRSFWQITEVDYKTSLLKNATDDDDDNDDNIVDDWEQLADSDDGKENDSMNIPAFIIHLDQPDTSEQYIHLYQIISLLRPDIHINGSKNQHHRKMDINIPLAYSISSPLLCHSLVSLNISFIQLLTTTKSTTESFALSWISFAHLLITTLPNLLWLYSAGCFDENQGPKVVSILSHGLRKLRFWDIGYHQWLLHMDLFTSIIDWYHDLRELKTLCLTPPNSTTTTTNNSNNNNNNADQQFITDLSHWLHINGLSRIKIVWNKI